MPTALVTVHPRQGRQVHTAGPRQGRSERRTSAQLTGRRNSRHKRPLGYTVPPFRSGGGSHARLQPPLGAENKRQDGARKRQSLHLAPLTPFARSSRRFSLGTSATIHFCIRIPLPGRPSRRYCTRVPYLYSPTSSRGDATTKLRARAFLKATLQTASSSPAERRRRLESNTF